jgi:hypothetical protein
MHDYKNTCFLPPQLGSHDEFRATLRMPPDVYEELLNMVSPVIRRQNTNFRMSISPEERLSMTMRYLALGMFEYESHKN